MWTNWAVAFGAPIEFVGFATLAYDVWQGSKNEFAETTDPGCREVRSGAVGGREGAGIELSGGLLGKHLAAIRDREDQLRRRMGLIVRGVLISAARAFLQIVGSFGQALNQ
jgi:hypothetical protein